jgi:hypothetical protein
LADGFTGSPPERAPRAPSMALLFSLAIAVGITPQLLPRW